MLGLSFIRAPFYSILTAWRKFCNCFESSLYVGSFEDSGSCLSAAFGAGLSPLAPPVIEFEWAARNAFIADLSVG